MMISMKVRSRHELRTPETRKIYFQVSLIIIFSNKHLSRLWFYTRQKGK